MALRIEETKQALMTWGIGSDVAAYIVAFKLDLELGERQFFLHQRVLSEYYNRRYYRPFFCLRPMRLRNQFDDENEYRIATQGWNFSFQIFDDFEWPKSNIIYVIYESCVSSKSQKQKTRDPIEFISVRHGAEPDATFRLNYLPMRIQFNEEPETQAAQFLAQYMEIDTENE